ncbi:MAG: serine/threonine-protein kinase, partial [bacterium]
MKAQFGRYVFLKKLAVGGMAEIFLARRLSFGGFARFVVLKRLLPEHRGRKAYERLFLGESRITALLDHPNVISLHDLGKLDDAYFMAMEYIHGLSGAELMAAAARARTAVPIGVALRLAMCTADALQYCAEGLDLDGHAFGVIHHDVSPHNIQVGFDGAVKLLDFGVATQVGRPAPAGRRGKFAYMSPEAMAKGDVDTRSDLFSLGVVLYELTVGKRLFKGATPDETRARAEAGAFRRPSEVSRDYPPMLEAITLKALARDRGDRYQTAQELSFDLANAARALRADTSPEATAAWLREIMGPEIDRRRHELYALAVASAARRPGAPTEASVALLDPSVPPGEAPTVEMAIAAVPRPDDDENDDDEAADDAGADDAEAERDDAREDAAAPAGAPPDEAAEAPEVRLARAEEQHPEAAPPDDPAPDYAEPDPSTGDFLLPTDAISADNDWDAMLDAPIRTWRRLTLLIALLGAAAAVGTFFVGQIYQERQAAAGATGVLRIESEPAGAT